MRVLICGDIHGNLIALEKMLKHENKQYDLFVSHGDVVNYGPWSDECVDLIETIDQRINLLGNHEENYLQGHYPGKNAVANAFFDFCFPKFNRFEVIKEFKNHCKIGKFDIQHTVNKMYIYPDSDIESILNENKSNFIVGHSHHQFAFESSSGHLLYNTGSVGQNRKYINVINYLIYDDEANKVELKNLTYDVKILITEMNARNYPKICLDYYQSKSTR